MFFVFSTLGMRMAISADNGGSKTIFDLEFNTRHTDSANPKIVITALALPILKLLPLPEKYHFQYLR